MTQNRVVIISGISIVILLLLFVGAGVVIARLRNTPPSANQKELILKLDYCNPDNIKPCIVSFSQDGNGTMSVNVLVPSRSFPNFYLVINRGGEEHRYECEKVKDLPNSLTCIGREMFPGEIMQFTLIASQNETVLAEGNFAIIGLMLATPEAATTELAGAIGTEQPTEFPTPFLLDIPTPIPTVTEPAYPNPSYPNPSYPNQ